MIRSVMANPYIRWLVRRKSRPSVGSSIILFCILWVLSASLTLARYLQNPATQSYPHQLLWKSLLFGAFLTILVAVAFGIFITSHELHSDRPLLLKLSSITDSMIVSGYVFHALYYLRIPLLIVGGLTPAIAIGWAHFLAVAEVIQRCRSSVSACQLASPPPGVGLSAALLIVSGIMTFVLLSMAFTGAAIGVWMTMMLKRPGLAAFASAGVLLGGLAPLAFFFFLYINTALYIVLRDSSLASVAVILGATIAMGLIPHLLIGEGSLRAATQRIWTHMSLSQNREHQEMSRGLD